MVGERRGAQGQAVLGKECVDERRPERDPRPREQQVAILAERGGRHVVDLAARVDERGEQPLRQLRAKEMVVLWA